MAGLTKRFIPTAGEADDLIARLEGALDPAGRDENFRMSRICAFETRRELQPTMTTLASGRSTGQRNEVLPPALLSAIATFYPCR
jgi:hypothetical protein